MKGLRIWERGARVVRTTAGSSQKRQTNTLWKSLWLGSQVPGQYLSEVKKRETGDVTSVTKRGHVMGISDVGKIQCTCKT